ncbi:hypothetical protein B4U79_17315 [Dinothrombium tinctorium]|uniref:MD-2-related lipid-recognition domain-containing protein n=1 Tax=Dinothrombium tinctorium TaxID=1965070 RepID=A0A3S3R3V5_9ACAR|nr:hypothetical protein B4U79_17315 [Dinothrombium tinctorium]
MKLNFHLLVFFTFLFAENVLTFKWKDCGKRDATVHIDDIKIQPETPQLGKPLHIGASFTVDEPIEPGTISSLKISKYVGRLLFSVPVPIPCVAGYGSCKSSLCELFSYQNGPVCKFLKNVGSHCGCPIKPGQYKSYGDEPVVLPSGKGIRGLIARVRLILLVSIRMFYKMYFQGRYKLVWKWLTPDKKEIACLEGDIKLK